MLWLALVVAANGPSPAYVSPTALWGELKPSDTVTIAAGRDRSGFNDTLTPYSAASLSIAVEGWNGALLEAQNTGFAVWDLTANPKNPPKLGGFTTPGFPKAPSGAAGNVFVADLAAPPLAANVATLALDNGAGVALVSVLNKATPAVLYQDGDPAAGGTKSCRDAYAATIAGKPYALAACAGGPGVSGVALYDLTAAAAIAAPPCQEVAPNASSACPGVFVAQGALVRQWMDMGVAKDKAVTRLDGVEQFVVTNASTGGGFDLWDLASVSAPKHLATGPLAYVGPVGMWKHNDRYFVAALSSTALEIFEVTKVVKGTSTDVGSPLSTYPPMRQYEAETRLLVSKAADGSVVLSYASGREPPHDMSAVGATEELLFDATDPTDPRIITPPGTLVNGVQTTYFGYSHQFGWVRPMGARFVGFFLYRAAGGVLDVHQWMPPLNRSPTITSTPPATAVVNRAYDYVIAATDPEGKTLKYTFTAAPAGMAFLAPGEVSWVPGPTDVGMAQVIVNVSDGRNNVPHGWTITVTDGKDAGTSPTDGGTSDGGTGPMKPTGGCGCSAQAGQTENNSPFWLALLGALGYFLRHAKHEKPDRS